MKLRITILLLTFCLLNSCVSVPKETVQLSTVIGTNIKVLENSHTTMVGLFYSEIINNINDFIEEVYAPFIINYVLNKELDNYKKNISPSIFETIYTAASDDISKTATSKVLTDMSDFLNAAQRKIENKRKELLIPVKKQRDSIILNIKISYVNTMQANSSVTNYLQSISNLKESQQKVLSVIGLKGKAEELNKSLLKVSELTKTLLAKGKEIDLKSDEAFQKMKTLTNTMKSITNKK
jgi:hypothetical protein